MEIQGYFNHVSIELGLFYLKERLAVVFTYLFLSTLFPLCVDLSFSLIMPMNLLAIRPTVRKAKPLLFRGLGALWVWVELLRSASRTCCTFLYTDLGLFLLCIGIRNANKKSPKFTRFKQKFSEVRVTLGRSHEPFLMNLFSVKWIGCAISNPRQGIRKAKTRLQS